jgi:hypothetical protein
MQRPFRLRKAYGATGRLGVAMPLGSRTVSTLRQFGRLVILEERRAFFGRHFQCDSGVRTTLGYSVRPFHGHSPLALVAEAIPLRTLLRFCNDKSRAAGLADAAPS